MSKLLSFTIKNFRSIAAAKRLILTGADCDGYHIDESSDSIQTATAIYGANSSGKSNVIKGYSRMQKIILESVRLNKTDSLPYEPFILRQGVNVEPTSFEVDFLLDGKRYRYGFSYTERAIHDEWLVEIDQNQSETELFIRTIEGIGVDEAYFAEGKDLEEKTNDNRLFLSLVGQLGGKLSNRIIAFFNYEVNAISGLYTKELQDFTSLIIDGGHPGTNEMKKFFNHLQLGFADISVEKELFNADKLSDKLSAEYKAQLIKENTGKYSYKEFSSHQIYDEKGNVTGTTLCQFDKMESSGTQKLYQMAGPIFDTLLNGTMLFIDELDAKMHPLLSLELVKLFKDKELNRHNAQLVFTTHDTNLLSSGLLDKSQVWLTEKNEREETDLYAMSEVLLPDGSQFDDSENLERNYIQGRYGAIPYIKSR